MPCKGDQAFIISFFPLFFLFLFFPNFFPTVVYVYFGNSFSGKLFEIKAWVIMGRMTKFPSTAGYLFAHQVALFFGRSVFCIKINNNKKTIKILDIRRIFVGPKNVKHPVGYSA